MSILGGQIIALYRNDTFACPRWDCQRFFWKSEVEARDEEMCTWSHEVLKRVGNELCRGLDG